MVCANRTVSAGFTVFRGVRANAVSTAATRGVLFLQHDLNFAVAEPVELVAVFTVSSVIVVKEFHVSSPLFRRHRRRSFFLHRWTFKSTAISATPTIAMLWLFLETRHSFPV